MVIAKKYDTIMEGCFPDTPDRLLYSKLPFHIHENIKVLTIGNGKYREKDKYLLYDGSIEDIQNIPEGGFPIENLSDLALWTIFDAQRSFITRDGRIYIESGYFEENWKWYLDNIFTILNTCEKLFKEEVTEFEINENPDRAF